MFALRRVLPDRWIRDDTGHADGRMRTQVQRQVRNHIRTLRWNYLFLIHRVNSSGRSKGGRRGRAPPPPRQLKFLHFHAVFGENWQNHRLAPPRELAPPPRGNPGSATEFRLICWPSALIKAYDFMTISVLCSVSKSFKLKYSIMEQITKDKLCWFRLQ